LNAGAVSSRAAIIGSGPAGFYTARVASLVTWSGWERIDAHETALGEPQGRPRVKLVRVSDMHEVAGEAATVSR
jgi:ferredoxin/flavodoxin---NADP+ reductase